MPSPPSLPAALAAQAAADPEAPFLFWAEGWNWRWWPWRRVAELAARWAGELGSLPPGSRAAFAATLTAASVVLDLAVQAAGLVPVPAGAPPPGSVEEPAPARPEAAARGQAMADVPPRTGESAGAVALPGEPSIDEQGVWLDVAGDELRITPWRPRQPRQPLQAAESALGGTSAAGARRRLPQERLVVAATRIADAVGATPGREILVLAGGLDEQPVRLLVAWAVLAGAAVVLEPDPARWQATALWARPTVLYGAAADLAALGRHLDRRHQPGRLRTLFQPGEPDPAEAAAWQRRGVRLLRLPEPGEDGG